MTTSTEVTRRQIVLIGTLYVISTSVLSVQAQAVAFTRQHMWLSYLVVFGVLLLPLWILFGLATRERDRDLFRLLIERYPVAGRIVTSVYMLYFFWIAVRDVRVTSDFLKVSIFQRTPMAVITAIIVWAVVMLIRETGIRVLARSTEIYAPLLLLLVPFIVIMLAKDVEIRYILPLQEIDLPGVFQGAWLLGAYMGDILGIAFLVSGNGVRFRDGVTGLMLATGSLMIVSTLAVMMLSVPVMAAMTFPIYELVRQIRLTDFLDRFELPILAIWIPTVICKIGYSLYLVCLGFKRLVPDISGKRLAIPLGTLLFSCSFWFFENAVDMINMNLTMPAVLYLFQLVIPVLLFAALWPKRRPAREGVDGGTKNPDGNGRGHGGDGGENGRNGERHGDP